jgi:hypothetical protein
MVSANIFIKCNEIAKSFFCVTNFKIFIICNIILIPFIMSDLSQAPMLTIEVSPEFKNYYELLKTEDKQNSLDVIQHYIDLHKKNNKSDESDICVLLILKGLIRNS